MSTKLRLRLGLARVACAVLGAFVLSVCAPARADGIRWSDHSEFDVLPINLTRRVDGVQIGFWNVTHRLNGFQLAYGCTQIADEMNGMQLGLMSNWSDRARGVQLGGLLNISKDLQGLQIGLINGTQDSSGFSLGLVNWVSEGRMMLEAMATSPGFVDASFRNGNRFYQYTYTAGVNLAHHAAHFGGGLGGHIALPWGSLDLDLFAFIVTYGPPKMDAGTGKQSYFSENGAQGELRLSTSLQVTRSLSLVLAASMHVFSGGPDGSYVDYGFSRGPGKTSFVPGASLGIRLGRVRYPESHDAESASDPSDVLAEEDRDAIVWDGETPTLVPLELQGSYKGRDAALTLTERDGWLLGPYVRRSALASQPRTEGLAMLRWNEGVLSGTFLERQPDGNALRGEIELRPAFRKGLLWLDGRSRRAGDATWDDHWDFYKVFTWPSELERRFAQARFDFATTPALEQTPKGAWLVQRAPALFQCLYAGTPLFHDVFVAAVETDGTRSSVRAFLRGVFPNGWRAEREVVVTVDAAGQRTLELGLTNIPDPVNTGCTLPP